MSHGTVAAPENVAERPHTLPSSYLAFRDVLDRWAALLGLLLLAPLMLWLAWRVRSNSPGPALFSQDRAGRHGRSFRFLKFRSMRTDVDPYADSPQSGEDPRITRLGRWLRESSLDELPQLINVLCGEMSLVGPRPLFVSQIAAMTPRQRQRVRVKPGLTGLSQVFGRASLTIEEKLEYDLEYLRIFGARTDAWILWLTFRNLFVPVGIYQTRYSEAAASFRAGVAPTERGASPSSRCERSAAAERSRE